MNKDYKHNLILNAQNLGENIRKVRKYQGLSQEDLASIAGTGIRFIIDLEKGKPTIQLAKTLLILKTLGIDLYTITKRER